MRAVDGKQRIYLEWPYPAVQHLTASAGGGKGIPLSLGKKFKKEDNFYYFSKTGADIGFIKWGANYLLSGGVLPACKACWN